MSPKNRAPRGQGQILRRPSGAFLVKVPSGKYPNGKTRYVTKTALTKTEAIRIRSELLRERDAIGLAAGPKTTLRVWALEILGSHSGSVSERTLSDYRRTLTKHVFPVLGAKAIREIRSREIQELLNGLRQTHSASTVNNVRSALSKVFTEAVRHNVATVNPVRHTEKFRRGEFEKTQVRLPWSEEEVAQVRSALANHPLEAPILLMIVTGLRLGELLGLKWADVQLDLHTISIERTISHPSLLWPDGTARRELVIRPPKTAQSKRVLQLQSPTMDLLIQHRARQEFQRAMAGADWVENDWIFTTQFGAEYDERNFRRAFLNMLHQHGIRRIRLHDIRHTFATILVNRDSGQLSAVSKALGHSNLQITLGTYANTARVEKQATAAISAIVFPDIEPTPPSNPPDTTLMPQILTSEDHFYRVKSK